VSPGDAGRHVEDIASANWHASAMVAARACGSALFMDMGSTTTDIVPLRYGKVAASGYTDMERLSTGELVYTGLVRSFLMAIAPPAPSGGRGAPPANEIFPPRADVPPTPGRWREGADQKNPADGRDKTVAASRARLARIIGCDAADADDAAWTALARWFAEA